ncbi:envelope stress response membrane protein PspB [Croceicoccus marinus]|uniref:Envelope stress response membrane protein PspB n=1 Tax=Croceicoccus marinus TaxID=450378 RepID=A0A1Z1FBT4_9SPHN|nr:envelope stress response membrane protein PspB [Croceicoccus marinus]ARU16225.1 phage shock protein B [Croceicoccus marinus]QNE06380.1 envelope stress response membrane protein PspB [Croceicoccus marinus]
MEGVLAIICIFVVLPGLVFHYVTKWKTAPTLTQGDEAMLEELYKLARRLDDRMDTVERLVAADNEEFSKPRLIADQEADNVKLAELERMMKERNAQ